MKNVLTDVLKAARSKRVILATLTAAIIAINQQLNYFDAETVTKITALAATVIVGDSLRPTSKPEAK